MTSPQNRPPRRAAFACCLVLLFAACDAPNTTDAPTTEPDVAVAAPEAAAPPASSLDSPLASPSRRYPGLFEAVATSGVFEPKDWVDAHAKAPPAEILEAWRAAGSPTTGGPLAHFVARYFEPPASAAAGAELDLPADRTLAEHIEALWPALTRRADAPSPNASLLPLPEPYIVPGGRFREVYYWDAYFTMTGLGARHDAIKRAMADNFAHEIAAYGFVPNANRTYYLSRSQPPFFFMMVSLLAPDAPETAYADYLDALKAEHAFWMRGERAARPGAPVGRVVRLADGALLNRYFDDREDPREESHVYDVKTAEEADRPAAQVYRDLRAGAESGWDFSSRWLDDPQRLATIRATDIVPVDLNSILYGLERAIAAGCDEARDPSCEEEFASRAAARAQAVRAHLWDNERGYFTDLDHAAARRKPALTAATSYPLFFRLANDEEAARVAKAIEGELLREGGVVSTLIDTGEQWDAPNGWAPLQWLTAIGLANYGHDALAEDVARRWTTTVARGFCESGKLVEKYDVVEPKPGGGGEYPTQDGFGWTNGVTMAFLKRYENLAPLGETTPATDAPETCAEKVASAR
ncbi:MAG: alpha,alpha-trehalase TreF [Parvularculaceae bacterium]